MNKVKLVSFIIGIMIIAWFTKSLSLKVSNVFNQIEKAIVLVEEQNDLKDEIKKNKELESNPTFLKVQNQNEELKLSIEQLISENEMIEKEIELASKKDIDIKDTKWRGVANDVVIRGIVGSFGLGTAVNDISISGELNFSFTNSGLNVSFYSESEERDISIAASLEEIDEEFGLLKYRSVKENIHSETFKNNSSTDFYFVVDGEKMTCYIVNRDQQQIINLAFELTRIS